MVDSPLFFSSSFSSSASLSLCLSLSLSSSGLVFEGSSRSNNHVLTGVARLALLTVQCARVGGASAATELASTQGFSSVSWSMFFLFFLFLPGLRGSMFDVRR